MVEQLRFDLDAGNTEAAQNTAAEIAQDSINETLADLEQDDILDTLKSQEMMDVVSKLFFNGSNEVITPQEIGEIYNRDQVGKAYDQAQRKTNEIGGPADIARIWNDYQNQQTAEPAGDQGSSNDGTGQTSETVIPELLGLTRVGIRRGVKLFFG